MTDNILYVIEEVSDCDAFHKCRHEGLKIRPRRDTIEEGDCGTDGFIRFKGYLESDYARGPGRDPKEFHKGDSITYASVRVREIMDMG